MSGFQLIPAIDLLDGECVRLTQGRYDEKTIYDADPPAVAKRFAEHAVGRIHVVDLDGARSGRPQNREAVRAIAEAAGSIPVQLGGGVRSLESAESAFELGVERVIFGTVALREPELVREGAARFPGRIAVGIDARDGWVAVEGWVESSEVRVSELAKRFEDAGVASIIYTDIGRDGTLEGPNLESTAALARSLSIPVIASGGIASEEDVLRVAALADCGIAGVIVGRAIYTGAVQLSSALARIEQLTTVGD